MRLFFYSAKSGEGYRIQSQILAVDEKAALGKLTRLGYSDVSVDSTGAQSGVTLVRRGVVGVLRQELRGGVAAPCAEVLTVEGAPAETHPLVPPHAGELPRNATEEESTLPLRLVEQSASNVIFGESMSSLRNAVVAESALPLNVLVDKSKLLAPNAAAPDKPPRKRTIVAPRRVSRRQEPRRQRQQPMPEVDRMVFFGYLANMLNAGIPLQRALDSLRHQADERSSAVLQQLFVAVNSGQTLASGLAAMPWAFSTLEAGVVRAGEASGSLPVLLRRLAAYEERNLSLMRKVRSQLMYPLVVFAAAIVMILVLAHFLVAGVLPILQQERLTLSFGSALLVRVLTLTQQPGWLLGVAGLAGMIVLRLRVYAGTPNGKRRIDRALLSLPLVGSVLRRIETARACESVSTLYSSGLTPVQCLERAAEMCLNACGRDALHAASQQVRAGASLAEALAETQFFPRTVLQMVKVGEDSGRLSDMLVKIAQYNDLEARSALETCAAALEPVMIICMGVLVTAVILAAFAPLYQVIAAMN